MPHQSASNPAGSKRYPRMLFSIISLLILTFILPQLNAAPVQAIDAVPASLSVSDWASIQAQIKANRYHPQVDENGGYRAFNPAQGWRIDYRSNGSTELVPSGVNAPAYHIGFRFDRIGYGDQWQPMPAQPQRLEAQQDRLEYHWNDTLIERWTNSEHKLEQWFLLSERPSGAENGQPLQLQLTLDSDLAVRQTGNALQFSHESGVRIHYDRLKVWDADGQIQTAWLQLDGQQINLLIDEQHARYPLTIDPTLQQQAYLKASNTGANDEFAYSLAIDGDTIVVGARGEASNAIGVNGNENDNTAGDSGAAYVFTRSAGVWSQQAYLKASNTEANDEFGFSVAIDGDTIVVGAYLEDSNATGVDGDGANNLISNSGAAYVFTRSAGMWSQQSYLKASNTGMNDRFGYSVAISGDTVVVGARGESSNATGVDGEQANDAENSAGAAYVFTRDIADEWSQQAYLKASNTGAGDSFAWSVAIDGDTIVVGAHFEDSNATGVDGNASNDLALNAGAAYVFTRDIADEWSQQAYLKASNTEANDVFGYSVAISDDTVAIGARDEESNATGVDGDQNNNSASDAGSVYIFIRDVTDTWSQQAYLKASNTGADDEFGYSVAIDGDIVVVGAHFEDSNATGVDGGQSNNSALNAGAAYVFTRDAGDEWSQQTYLKASNTEADDEFGYAVAISDDTVVVGAHFEDSNANVVDGDQTNNSANSAGAAYVFDTAFLVVGTLNGLSSGTLVLQNNGGDDLTLTANGVFTFASSLSDGSAYNVTVQTQPAEHICTVTNGSGNINDADADDVVVDCVLITHSVGGNLNGLISGSLVLQNNDGDDLTLTADGAFTFATGLLDGNAYNVTVLTQPIGHSCAVTNGSGNINDADVSDVAVDCVLNNYTVGGNLNGLTSGLLVLQNNDGDDLTLTADGAFTFANVAPHGSAYNVTVLTQPVGHTCTVTNGSNNINGADVSDVAVDCVLNTHSVGGNLNGLSSGSLVLQNNGGDDLTLNADGVFTFATAVTHGNPYNVTVLTQPIGHTCTVTNGDGTINDADVSDVTVDCVLNSHTVGGNLNGLISGSLVLQNNDGDDLTLSADGAFTFATAVTHGNAYNVTILTQPIGHSCTVMNGSGSINDADVTDVVVDCVLNTYTIGGNLSGLATGQSLLLQNNGGDDLTLNVDGAFMFATLLDHGSAYNITVLTQPSEQICAITNGSGNVNGAEVSDVMVSCVDTYSVGGTLSGLSAGQTLVLQNNGGDDLSLSADRAFTFASVLADGSDYQVTVLTQPSGQTCTVSNGSGTIAGADITDVEVICVTAYTISGTLNGLAAGEILVLQNNGSDDLTLNADGAFTFTSALADGSDYEVSVLTQPNGQICTVTNGSGTLNGVDVSDITVSCIFSSFTVGGTLSGLATGETVVLQNNGGDDLILTTNGAFTFATELDNGSAYNITVLSQPTDQACTVTNGSGTLNGADISDVVVSCGGINIFSDQFE